MHTKITLLWLEQKQRDAT